VVVMIIPFIPLTMVFRHGHEESVSLGSLVSTPWTPKLFVYNRKVFSQAGRRGLPDQSEVIVCVD